MPGQPLERRTFLGLGAAALIAPGTLRLGRGALPPDPSADFPRQDQALVREMVTVSHGNLARVKELVTARPALARASIDWGYGDWESALEAASHVGNRPIAELLLDKGARPSIFSAAMLGQLAAVQAFVAATPGIQRTAGPHSIPLLAHARAGGEAARAVFDYLTSLGDANGPPLPPPLDAAGRERYHGTYRFGAGETDRLVVTTSREALTIARAGGTARTLRWLGDHQFHPVGAESVRIRFSVSGATAASVAVFDPDLLVSADRIGP